MRIHRQPVGRFRRSDVLRFLRQPDATGLHVHQNTAEKNGGGFTSDGLNFAAISLAECTSDSNGAMDGGAFWTSYSNPNFNFIENFAPRGGAGFIIFFSDPGMNGCDFSGNTSVSGAGTMQSSPDSLTTLAGSDFDRCCSVEPPSLFVLDTISPNDVAGNPYIACESCRSDVDCSGMVDAADLGLVIGAWATANRQYDLNGDENVDGTDLGVLFASWGR